MTSHEKIARIVARLHAAPALVVFLDYDGTLVPFAEVPEEATPDDALIGLLERLAARPRTTVHLVSGRPRDTLERWLAGLPIWLHAEHGFFSRAPGAAWSAPDGAPLAWRFDARAVFDEIAARTPGSVVEEKTISLAWHHRRVEPQLGAVRVAELRHRLSERLPKAPIDVLVGDRVLEVRPRGVHKGRVVEPALRAAPAGAIALAMGDDRTDEDLFAALPAGSVDVHVGAAASHASVRIRDWAAARALLMELVDAGQTSRA